VAVVMVMVTVVVVVVVRLVVRHERSVAATVSRVSCASFECG
jgi:hypothetical protein